MIKIEHPTFELVIPSSKQKIKYRPFTVKEEKILLMAQQSDNINDITSAIKQVINNCVYNEDFKIDKLMLFDLEYIFLKLRGNSVNNIISVSYKDKEDDKVYTVEIDINEIEVIFDTEHSNVIKLDENTTLVLSYPGMTLPESVIKAKSENESFIELIKSCLDKVYQGEDVYEMKDFISEQKDEFLNNLSLNNFDQIKNFFKTMPKLKHTISYVNSLGNKKDIVLETLNDFFTFR